MKMRSYIMTLGLGTALVLTASCGTETNNASDLSVIYGEDGRSEIHENDADSMYVKLARSTAMHVKKTDLSEPVDGVITIEAKTFAEKMKEFKAPLCKSEPYRDQPAAGFCSGFLVGKDTYVTAGHCIKTEADCAKTAIVFDAGYITDKSVPTSTTVKNVFYCKEIVETKLEHGDKTDFAVIKLDRKVEGRTPLTFRTTGKVSDKTAVTVIGHPSGLPTKITKGGAVRDNTPKQYFLGNLDTYGGNSGSPVFDAKTGVVEGILVRGERDFVVNPDLKSDEEQCYVSNRCTDGGCRGEGVTRATVFAEFVKLK